MFCHITIPYIRAEIKQNSVIYHTDAPSPQPQPPPPPPPERAVFPAARYLILGL